MTAKQILSTYPHDDELWRLEERFWLGDAAFYRGALGSGALMVLPPPTGVLGRAETIAAIEAAPRWRSVSFADRHLAFASETCALLVYRATADRGSEDVPYVAQCSSSYVRGEGGWRLVLHHQTPLAEVEGG